MSAADGTVQHGAADLDRSDGWLADWVAATITDIESRPLEQRAEAYGRAADELLAALQRDDPGE